MYENYIEKSPDLIYVEICPTSEVPDNVTSPYYGCEATFPRSEDYSSLNDIYSKLRGSGNVIQYQTVPSPSASCTYSTDGNGVTSSVCLAKAIIYANHSYKAVLSLLKTMMVMVILAVGSVLFQKDAQVLVLGPIERMVSSHPVATVADFFFFPQTILLLTLSPPHDIPLHSPVVATADGYRQNASRESIGEDHGRPFGLPEGD